MVRLINLNEMRGLQLKRIRSALLIVMAVILTLSLMLAGCTNNEKRSGSVNNGIEPQGDERSKEKELMTLKYLSIEDNFNPNEDHTKKMIEEILGYDIVSSMGNTPDKVNLILTSGQEYDMISMSERYRNALGTYIRNGAIQPLNEAIDKYGPNLKKVFSQEIWDMVSSNGVIYALPTTNYTAVTEGIVIREDWLKKLDLEVPTTVDEFYNVLKQFKEQDPGNVGSKLIPFAMSGASNWLDTNGLAQAFGIGKNPLKLMEKNGAIVSGIEDPGLKEYLSFLNKLYSQKLLDQDFPVMKRDKVVEKLGAGHLGAATLSAWDSAALRALRETDPEANLIFLPALKDADGNQLIENTGGLYQFLIVPKVSTKVDEVVKYANAFLEPENYSKLILGEEHVSYKVEDGKYYPIFPEFDKFNKGRFFYPVNESDMYTPLFGARARKEKEMGELWDDITSKNNPLSYSDIVNFAPMMPAVEKYGSELDVLVRDRLLKMVLDSSELDKLDELVKEWREKGGDAIVSEYNEWYKDR